MMSSYTKIVAGITIPVSLVNTVAEAQIKYKKTLLSIQKIRLRTENRVSIISGNTKQYSPWNKGETKNKREESKAIVLLPLTTLIAKK
jgi:hypothetical protein